MDDLDKYSNDQYLIKYDTMASLEHIVGVKIIIALLDYNQIKEQFTHKRFKIELNTKINLLRLPSTLHEKLMLIASFLADQICEWVKYHDEQIFNVDRTIECVALGFVDKIVWTSRGTIDYLQSAKNLLPLNISDHVKFRIAYAYCLNEQMVLYSARVLQPGYLKNTFPKHGRDFLPRSALYYWICYKYSDTSKVKRLYGYGIRSNCRVEEFFFNIFVQMPNHVLTKHIWDMLTKDERLERVMDLVTTNHVSSDLQLYFLSQLTTEEQYLVINCYLPYVFKILVNDFQVRSFYRNLVQHIWNMMSVADFIEIIKLLIISIDSTSGVLLAKYQQVFKDFWSTAPVQFRRQVIENYYYLVLQRDERLRGWQIESPCALLPQHWDNNDDIVELILSDATPAQCKCFLKTDSSLQYAIRAIKEGNYQILESFISKFLPNAEDKEDYKIAVLRGENYALVRHFCKSESPPANAFYRWCFSTTLQMSQFIVETREEMWYKMRPFFNTKQNITKIHPFLEWCLLPAHQIIEWVYQFQLDVWYDLIRRNDEAGIIGMVDIEYFLDWSFDTTSKLNKASIIIPRKVSLLTKFICSLIKRNNIQLLDQLLNWCFLYDQTQIRHFKNNFYEYCDIDDFLDLIHSIAINQNDKFHRFKTFFGSWFSNEKDFQAFKMKITQPQTSTWIGADFVARKWMKSADEFFKFCANFNDHEMIEFKFKILMHQSMADVLRHYESDESFVRNFLQWVDPPREKYQMFEEKFLSDVDLEFKLYSRDLN